MYIPEPLSPLLCGQPEFQVTFPEQIRKYQNSRDIYADSEHSLILGIGVSIWAVLKYAPLPYGDRVYIAVGLGIGVPCLFRLWIIFLQSFYNNPRKPILATVLLLGALASALWAIITKSSLDLSVKVSLSVELGVGLPCLAPIVFFIYDNSIGGVQSAKMLRR